MIKKHCYSMIRMLFHTSITFHRLTVVNLILHSCYRSLSPKTADIEVRNASRVCSPGPPLGVNPLFRNCLIIGDSISLGQKYINDTYVCVLGINLFGLGLGLSLVVIFSSFASHSYNLPCHVLTVKVETGKKYEPFHSNNLNVNSSN